MGGLLFIYVFQYKYSTYYVSLVYFVKIYIGVHQVSIIF